MGIIRTGMLFFPEVCTAQDWSRLRGLIQEIDTVMEESLLRMNCCPVQENRNGKRKVVTIQEVHLTVHCCASLFY
jgi:hypothetical protein